MKNHCIRCRERIDELDFYMETKSGRICSDCLIKEQQSLAPGEKVLGLFPKQRQDRTRAAAEREADKLRAMSLTQLRFSL